MWTPFEFAQLSHLKLNHSQAYLLLTDQATHNPTGDFALENGKVKADGTPKYTFAGISVMSPRLLDTVKAGETAPLAPLLKQAIQAGLVMGDLLSDAWVDVGTLARLENLNQKLSANK